MIIYITDTTLPSTRDILFKAYPEAVKYLEEMCKRTGRTRKQYMLLLEEMGYGDDDLSSVTFVRGMAEKFDMGVVRDNRKFRCDITTATIFNKPEYGN